MRKLYLWMVLSSAFFACKNDSIVENKYGIPQSLLYTEIVVDLDSLSLNSYPLHASFEYQGDDFLLAYNDITNAFDVFNFSAKTIYHIELMLEGPDAILHPSGIYVHSIDSIWVFTPNNIISLVDSTGKVKERIHLPVSE